MGSGQPHTANSISYRRAIELLAEHLGCENTEQAVYEERRSNGSAEYARRLLRVAGAEMMLIDEGYPPRAQTVGLHELSEMAGCEVRPIMRLESLAPGRPRTIARAVEQARERGYAALKTVVAYRGGLDPAALSGRVRRALYAALDANERSGAPLPVQIHTGLGDADLVLPRARPDYLAPLFERFPGTAFVLLHCYPFAREAGWLASVYANVYLDVSLAIPQVSRPSAVLAEALELAPVSKVLYASDGVGAPELYVLAAVWWRDALASVLSDALPGPMAEDAARMILAANARTLYRL